MGADTKILRSRMKSVASTLHLTKAMGLVASSKIRRANEAMFKAKAYAEQLDRTLQVLTAQPEAAASPFLRQAGQRTRLIIIAGDRGLAGGYNANILRLTAQAPQAEYIPIGHRACEYFGRDRISSEAFSTTDASDLATTLCHDFINEAYDRLGIIYTKYVSMMTQEATLQWVLPLSVGDRTHALTAEIEPDVLTVLKTVLPEYVAGVVLAAIRESFACEVAARRMAMDSADKNAGQMLDDLRLEYNRARQGSITQEITEIIAGSGN